MQLNITEKVEAELKTLINNAIDSGEIDANQLRMVIVRLDTLLERLLVCISNEWEKYVYPEEMAVIGSIGIAEWMDVADAAFETRANLESAYIERAQLIGKQYRLCPPPPVLTFEHISEEPYKAFLICLREELITQIQTAIQRAGSSYTQQDFAHVVGFVTYRLSYNLESEVIIQTFNHSEGVGPFHPVLLTLPDSKLTYPYLKLYTSGFRLFYPKGNLYENTDEESHIYTYGIGEVSYAYTEPDQIVFRLQDQFHDWELSGGHINKELGDLSEKDLMAAFNDLLNRYPDKKFDQNYIPDPILDAAGFDNWLHYIVDYNLDISYTNNATIYQYGEASFGRYLELLPKTHRAYPSVLIFLSARLQHQGRYQESLDLLRSVRNLSDHSKIHILENLFFLDQRDEFDQYSSTIEAKSEQRTIRVFNWLFAIKEHRDEPSMLRQVEKEMLEFQEEYEGYAILTLMAVALTKLYVTLNEPDQALYYLQSVPIQESIEQLLLKHELGQEGYVMEAYQQLLVREKEKEDFREWVQATTLVVPEEESPQRKKTLYENSYYVTHKIEQELHWVCPISENQFVGTRSGKEPQLMLGTVTEQHTVEILSTLIMPKSRNLDRCAYEDGVLYMADNKKGIVTYAVTDNKLVERENVYHKPGTKMHYSGLTVASGYVYVCNNEYLEIYDVAHPEAGPLSSSLYIDSGYYLFVCNNLLVVGAGGGLVLLIDIADKTQPKYLSAITEYNTPNRMHIEFIGQYMVSLSVFDISNPAAPQWCGFAGDELAPTYSFATEPNVPLISTGNEFLFTTLLSTQDQVIYTNWWESLNKQNHLYERLVCNLATVYNGDTIIGYSQYEIVILEKGVNPAYQKKVLDVQPVLLTMIEECCAFLLDNHPDFCIGKVVLQYKPDYGEIRFSFQGCASPVVLGDVDLTRELPVLSVSLPVYRYCSQVLKVQFNLETMQLSYNGEALVQEVIRKPWFAAMAARHVAVIIDQKDSYLHFPGNPWQPYRGPRDKAKPESVKDILASNNENLINGLYQNLSADPAILTQILDLLQDKPKEEKAKKQPAKHAMTNRSNTPKEPAPLSAYLIGPRSSQSVKEEDEDELLYDEISQRMRIKSAAFQLLCAHPNRNLVRDIMLNGMKYSQWVRSQKDRVGPGAVNPQLVRTLLNNECGLWDAFSEEPRIKSFLLEQMEVTADQSLAAVIAFRYGNYEHPSLLEHIKTLIADEFTFEDYKGYRDGIDLSVVPVHILKPLEPLLQSRLHELETASPETNQYRIEKEIVPVFALLHTLGYEYIPERIARKTKDALKQQERYMDSLFEEDEETEETFLIKLYRDHKVRRLLHYFEAGEPHPLWPVTEPREPYTRSWHLTIEQLWMEGTAKWGYGFKRQYVDRLAAHIAKEDAYHHDRLLAYQMVQYTYHHIQQLPELASLVEPLVLAIHQYKDKFPQETDFAAIKEKSKYTLLQSAWNDLRNKEWDLADQKAEALLAMDADMGQVYFLKARLLWLREGIPAYLAQQESFIEKVPHDAAAMARLYNLTGCALDVEQRYEEALPYFKKAALTASNEPMYVANIAEIYYKLHQSEEALKYAKAAYANGNQADIVKEIIQNKGFKPE